MTAGLMRASVYAVMKEVAEGTYVEPAAAASFVPLRPGNSLNFEPEILESDELLNDIGASKGAVGKEAVSGSHSAYLKHSGVEGQEPELGPMYESIFGSKSIASTEYDTVSGSTVSILKVNTGEGSTYEVGEALLGKDATNGYFIRNISSISGDDLTLNFNLSNAPASGVNLGKAVLYKPVSTGHPSFSTSKYLGNGHAIELSAGNHTSEMAITADANGFGEVEFSFAGTKYYYNPITITSASKYIDFTDDAGTAACSVPVKIYKTPIELAVAIQDALNGASAEDYTCTYSNVTGKFTIASATTAVLSLLWNSGANTANSIKTKIGFSNTNDTGSLTYTSDSAQTYAAPYTPSYDADNKIIIADIGHFESEQFTKELFFDLLTEKFAKFAVHISETNTNPVNYL